MATHPSRSAQSFSGIDDEPSRLLVSHVLCSESTIFKRGACEMPMQALDIMLMREQSQPEGLPTCPSRDVTRPRDLT